MGCAVNFFQPLDADMSVNLSGAEIFVTEHFLHTAQIGACIKQMSGKAVAELVRSKIGRKSCKNQLVLHVSLKTAGGDARAETVEKKRLVRTGADTCSAAETAVVSQSLVGVASERA